jgi:putative ABC transport system permease protein
MALIPQVAHQIDPSVMVATETYQQTIARTLEPSRITAILVAVLGVLAMVLAVVGMVGVVSYAASQRVREIGIRMVLGARQGDIVTLLVGQGVKLAGIGLLIGLAIATAGSLLLSASSVLFGLNPFDTLTFAGTSLLLADVAVLSVYLPAKRAAKLDAAVTLRQA